MIRIKPSHKGLLHRKLHVPQGQKIPQAKIKRAERSKSPALRKEANFADTAEHKFHHRRGAEVRHPASHGEFEALGRGKG